MSPSPGLIPILHIRHAEKILHFPSPEKVFIDIWTLMPSKRRLMKTEWIFGKYTNIYLIHIPFLGWGLKSGHVTYLTGRQKVKI